MILLDVNLVLYAYWPGSEHHRKALLWLEDLIASGTPVWLSWLGILAFLRIATDLRASERPMSMKEASAVIGVLLDQPSVSVLQEGDRHWQILSKLIDAAQVRGALVTDAHLAALAIEHGVTLATNDLDFRRFDELDVIYPLLEMN